MIRIEIIGNLELLDELTEKLQEKTPEQYYSVMPLTKGFGKKGYASGDAIWPESNFYCLILIDDLNANEDEYSSNGNFSQVQIFKDICDDIQKGAPKNSITIFATKTTSIL